MRNIDLNLLRVLHALLQTGSVTLAAQQLGVSQPSVSRSLAQLRQEMGDPLLIKTNKGMALTKKAEALKEPVEDWYASTRMILRTNDVFDPASISGKFAIASTDYGVLSVVSPAMQQIMEQAPLLELEIVPLMADSAAQLANGLADIVITGFDPEPAKTCSRHLFVESFCCVMRPSHPLNARLAPQGTIPIEDLIEWPHILTNLHGNDVDKIGTVLEENGLKRRAALRVPYFSAAPHLLHNSDALMIVPRRAAEAFALTCGLVARPFPESMGTFNYWLLWHERTRRDSATMWITDQFAAAFEKRDAATQDCQTG